MHNTTISVDEVKVARLIEIYGVKNFSSWVREQVEADLQRRDETCVKLRCALCKHAEPAFAWKHKFHGVCPNCNANLNLEGGTMHLIRGG